MRNRNLRNESLTFRFRISISNRRLSFGIIIVRYGKREGWHAPSCVEKLATSAEEGLKTNVRDDRSEFPFYHSDGWGMLRVVIKGWEPSSWSLSKCFIILSNFINPSSRDNLISSRPLLRNPFLETFYPKNVWRLTIARLIRFENVSRSLCNEIRCGEDCIFFIFDGFRIPFQLYPRI